MAAERIQETARHLGASSSPRSPNADRSRRLLPRAQVEPMTPVFGAVVRGVDLASCSDQDALDIADLLSTKGVLHFPGQQRMTVADQVAFARRFGEPYRHPSVRAMDGYPDVMKIHVDAASQYAFGSDAWHTDIPFEDPPMKYTILRLTTAPPDGGGDTSFAFMPAVLRKFSPAVRELIAKHRAMHESEHAFRGAYGEAHRKVENGSKEATRRPWTRPRTRGRCIRALLRTPRSGVQSLYLNPAAFTTAILGLYKLESRAMLDLVAHMVASATECQLRVRWSQDSLTMWDNRLVQHTANWDYVGATRTAYRVTVLCRDQLYFDAEGRAREDPEM